MSLMKEILEAKIKRDEVLVCFLGQTGFIFRTPEVSLCVDPYLSDSCGKNEAMTKELGVALVRALPILINPEELDVDFVFATHEHQDHADPETLTGIKAEKTKIVGPTQVIKLLADLGIPAEKGIELNAGEVRAFGSASVRAVYARHAPGNVGYVFEVAGLKFYTTGDSEFDERLLEVAQYAPDVLLVCINGKWGNMTSTEAVELTRRLHPKVVIPMHYDMFTVNSADPKAFAEAVGQSGSSSRVVILEPGKINILSGATL
jgi:L-ascorbate 6-phosphate lactonase